MRWFWLDRFTEFVSGSHATAVKAVALSEEHLHDHWPAYPLMPHSLIAEGMAQTGGLLVSETYRFKELVVLAKFSKCIFHGETRPGDVLTYHAQIEHASEDGASVKVVAHVKDHLQAEAEIFFARLQTQDLNSSGEGPEGATRLFNPAHLLHWLRLVAVFDVGTTPDGQRLRPADYGFETTDGSDSLVP